MSHASRISRLGVSHQANWSANFGQALRPRGRGDKGMFGFSLHHQALPGFEASGNAILSTDADSIVGSYGRSHVIAPTTRTIRSAAAPSTSRTATSPAEAASRQKDSTRST